MKIIRSIKAMSVYSRQKTLQRKTIGFVPTMGALHAGHASLIRRARQDNDCVVVSIFVNPTQFGRHEDFKKYPRKMADDLVLCRKEKVDVIFAPPAGAMYPAGFRTRVEVGALGDCLCGRSRPGHFKGVATVVVKLFNIVRPTQSYFGQKDAQQAAVIERMVSDFNIPVSMRIVPTVREDTGLALSSRNAYLSPREKVDALVLSQALALAQDFIRAGVKDTAVLKRIMQRLICTRASARADYIAIVDKKTLEPVRYVRPGDLIAVAVWIGKTRLIDNVVVS